MPSTELDRVRLREEFESTATVENVQVIQVSGFLVADDDRDQLAENRPNIISAVGGENRLTLVYRRAELSDAGDYAVDVVIGFTFVLPSSNSVDLGDEELQELRLELGTGSCFRTAMPYLSTIMQSVGGLLGVIEPVGPMPEGSIFIDGTHEQTRVLGQQQSVD